MELDITKVVEEIAMQAKETQEEFIFETIQPYCENILQMKINKEELKQILLNGTQQQEPCEDSVSREEVKREIRRWLGYLDEDMISRINMGIDRLPSVTPTRPKGEWIEPDRHYDREIYRKCSNCNTNVDVNVKHYGMGIHIIPKKMYFCPVCGADMRGDADERTDEPV